MKLVERTIDVHAPADLLYELLTDAEHLVRWMAASAEVDAQVGGTTHQPLAGLRALVGNTFIVRVADFDTVVN